MYDLSVLPMPLVNFKFLFVNKMLGDIDEVGEDTGCWWLQVGSSGLIDSSFANSNL